MPSRRKLLSDRWEIVRPLGEGGQAHTFIVRDVQTGMEQFVLKRLKNPHRLGRFEREVQALRLIESERVPMVVDFRTDPSMAYVVTAYRGLDLQSALKAHPLDFLQRLEVFRDFVIGVAVGLTHRDIKPNNVVVDANHRGAVIDFGICQMVDEELILTTTDEAFGNAAFAAPECFLGSDD